MITSFADVEACLSELSEKVSEDMALTEDRIETIENVLEDTTQKVDCQDFELDQINDFRIKLMDRDDLYKERVTAVAKKENREFTEREQINMFLKGNYKSDEVTELERFEDFLSVNFSQNAVEEALTILETDIRKRMKEEQEQQQLAS